MARIFTTGYEIAQNATDTAPPDGVPGATTGFVTRDTAIKRTGAASAKFFSSDNSQVAYTIPPSVFTGAANRSYFIRLYLYIPSFNDLPDQDAYILTFFQATNIRMGVKLSPSGTLKLWNGGTNTIMGSQSGALSFATWYRVELRGDYNASTLLSGGELMLNGVSVATGSITPAVGINNRWGWIESPNSGTADKIIYIDDVAGNDSTGSVNNSWPGEGKVVLMTPTSDSQRGSWTGGAGGTTNLWEALNNTPPDGKAAETNLTQIESADTSGNNATDEYRGACGTYLAAGLAAGDVINAIHTMCCHGEDGASQSTAGSLGCFDNPVESAVLHNYGAGTTALGTWPTNWRWQRNAVQEMPTVTKSSPLIIALRKTDVNAAVGSVCFLGAYVDYSPGGVAPVQLDPTGLARTPALGAPQAWPVIFQPGGIHTRALGALKTSPTVLIASLVRAVRAVPAPAVSPRTLPLSITHARALGTISKVSPRLLPTGLVHTRGQGTIVVMTPILLPLASITRTRTLSAITMRFTLSPTGLTRTRALGVPRFNPAPASLIHTRGIGTHKIQDRFTPVSLTRTRALGAPTRKISFSVSGLVHARVLGTTAVRNSVLIAGLVHGRGQGTHKIRTAVVPLSLTRLATRAQGGVSVSTFGAINVASNVRVRGTSTPRLSPQVRLTGAGLSRTRLQGAPKLSPQARLVAIVHTRGQGSAKVSGGARPLGLSHVRALGVPPTFNASSRPSSLARTRVQGALGVKMGVTPPSLSHTRALGSWAFRLQIYIPGLLHGKQIGGPTVSVDGIPPPSQLEMESIGFKSGTGAFTKKRAVTTK